MAVLLDDLKWCFDTPASTWDLREVEVEPGNGAMNSAARQQLEQCASEKLESLDLSGQDLDADAARELATMLPMWYANTWDIGCATAKNTAHRDFLMLLSSLLLLAISLYLSSFAILLAMLLNPCNPPHYSPCYLFPLLFLLPSLLFPFYPCYPCYP